MAGRTAFRACSCTGTVSVSMTRGAELPSSPRATARSSRAQGTLGSLANGAPHTSPTRVRRSFYSARQSAPMRRATSFPNSSALAPCPRRRRASRAPIGPPHCLPRHNTHCLCRPSKVLLRRCAPPAGSITPAPWSSSLNSGAQSAVIVFQSLVTDVMLTSGSLKTAIAAFLDVAPADILVARPPGACEHLGPQGSRLKLTNSAPVHCARAGQGRAPPGFAFVHWRRRQLFALPRSQSPDGR
jgi:hypothetical protein